MRISDLVNAPTHAPGAPLYVAMTDVVAWVKAYLQNEEIDLQGKTLDTLVAEHRQMEANRGMANVSPYDASHRWRRDNP